MQQEQAARVLPAIAAVLLLGVAACGREAPPPAALTAPVPIASPAPPSSGEPGLTAGADGELLMSWTEATDDGGHALRYAAWRDGRWTAPRTVASGKGWFVNWADFPSLRALPDGSLAAHWLVRSADARYAYDVHIARSLDGGATWGAAIVPHDDGTPTEHGFASLFPHDGELGAVWLDGREFAGVDTTHTGGHGGAADMTLRFATIDRTGTVHGGVVLDARTCECCQTAAAVTSEGPIVAYRDRSPDEIRDIAIVRLVDGRWSEPTRLHPDEWHIAGCPVNGPAIVAAGRRVAVAWFTAANEEARVSIAFSDDAGRSFGPPFRIDDGDPSGRVDALLLDDGSALVSWLERTAEGAEIRVRRARPDGRTSSATRIAGTSGERASGFPRMARSANEVLFAWTVPGSPREVHVAAAPLPGGN
jgi:hypothetical protein